MNTTYTVTAPAPFPQVCDELLLRCDCGIEHLSVDLWFTTNAADFRLKDKEQRKPDSPSRWFDEGYLTVTQGYGYNKPWRDRMRAAWALLRGREYLISSVILKPADHEKIRQFFKAAS